MEEWEYREKEKVCVPDITGRDSPGSCGYVCEGGCNFVIENWVERDDASNMKNLSKAYVTLKRFTLKFYFTSRSTLVDGRDPSITVSFHFPSSPSLLSLRPSPTSDFGTWCTATTLPPSTESGIRTQCSQRQQLRGEEETTGAW